MTDRSNQQPATAGQAADGKLTGYRLAWTAEEPAWQLTTDLEAVPEAEMF